MVKPHFSEDGSESQQSKGEMGLDVVFMFASPMGTAPDLKKPVRAPSVAPASAICIFSGPKYFWNQRPRRAFCAGLRPFLASAKGGRLVRALVRGWHVSPERGAACWRNGPAKPLYSKLELI